MWKLKSIYHREMEYLSDRSIAKIFLIDEYHKTSKIILQLESHQKNSFELH